MKTCMRIPSSGTFRFDLLPFEYILILSVEVKATSIESLKVTSFLLGGQAPKYIHFIVH